MMSSNDSANQLSSQSIDNVQLSFIDSKMYSSTIHGYQIVLVTETLTC